ncbi:hypothetical protein HB904_17020 [Listeria booriae]|uniref:Uncharacterized protein n=1 Tax=Listeria booriae TaxID=1552123 RepID=A0A842AN11_9LIST|nr:hypothetical protein [Listeria booriae]MBC1402150.1 hypothetical protein [Listeria booriae]MBC1617882.1 hypothetical protein [Listeria booriae]
MADDFVKAYVTTDNEGFVTGWCNKEILDENGAVIAEATVPDNAVEVSTNPDFIEDLDSIKIVNGVAFFDEERRKKAIEQANVPNPIDAINLELADLIAELYDRLEKLEGGE